MTREEAIQHCKIQAEMKNETDFTINNYILGTAIEIVLNLIQEQQKELEKKDKIIDAMAEYIDLNCNCIKGFDKCEEIDDPHCIECIIRHFKRKIESEDKQC